MKKLYYSYIIQILGLCVVLILNYLLLQKIGGVLYLKLSFSISIFTLINYFDFGYIGLIRRVIASTVYSRNIKIGLFYLYIKKIFKNIIIYEFCLFILILLIRVPIEIKLALMLSPIMIIINSIRAYYEGNNKIEISIMLRMFYGIIIWLSPFVAYFILKSYLYYPFIIFFIMLLIIFIFFFRVKYISSIKKEESLNINNIPLLEILFMISGIILLYFDRFFLRFFDLSSKSGQYIFMIDLAMRMSLIYVPLVLYIYPKIVKLYDERIKDIFIKKIKFYEKTIAIRMFLISLFITISLSIFFKIIQSYNFNINNNLFNFDNLFIFIIILFSFSLNALNYYYQRILSLLNIQPIELIFLYAKVILLYISLFLLFYYFTDSKIFLAFSILIRVIVEFYLLRTKSIGHI